MMFQRQTSLLQPRPLVVAVCAALIATGSSAVAAPPVGTGASGADDPRPSGHVVQDQEGARRYQACIKTARKKPGAALSVAENWAEEVGDGSDARAAADHCAAVAQVGLDAFAAAARRFDRVAAHIRDNSGLLSRLEPGSTDLKLLISGVVSQAGNAWLMAGDPEAARQRFAEGLSLLPETERFARLEMRVDLARAAAAAGAYEQAVTTLDAAIEIAPDRLDILLYRATAKRHLGRFETAEADVEKVIADRPRWGQAWLEKGNILARQGDFEGARSAWHRVLRFEQESPAAVAARDNLNRLDPRIEDGGERDGTPRPD